MVGRSTNAKRRRPGGATSGSKLGGGRRAAPRESADAFDDSTDFFLAGEEDSKKAGESDSEPEEEDLETADEKRLRLAKAYLDRVKQQAAEYGSSDEDGEESGGDNMHREYGSHIAQDGGVLHDRISSQLQKDFMEGAGHTVRRLACHVRIPEQIAVEDSPYGAGRLLKGHHWSVTGLALTSDDSTAFSVSKDGTLLRWDVETGSRIKMPLPGQDSSPAQGSGPDWVLKQAKREAGAKRSLHAVAVSTDRRYLAAGGGDAAVHIWDARSNKHIKSLRSHKEAITGLAFREGEPTLFSSSYDRTVKIWSVSEMAYVDTLYGHQSEVLSVSARRAERCVSTGNDFTCRMWKIPEESQLVFRGHVSSIDCSCYVSTSDWMTGATDGSLSLWNPMRKKPVFTFKGAHEAAEDNPTSCSAAGLGNAAAWVQSVACAWGADLAASGAGDGKLRLWQVSDGRHGKTLTEHSMLPARGFINALAVARSGRFVLAGLGQEPRLGRWARNPRAKNGVLLHSLSVDDNEN
mmetsp:Transcript_37965/g.107255  ORF Transcript_37965/g.107255 Transcript_37965/m.107255 type:complete len:519 (-) Transcript_37965:1039-2595(-)|eukprot:CAMPEP_0117656580 /NCGR_PEP_ID=MMETSP0804-20121206/4880_1 /TAXON_ID=1074897 /ORGANISM="Tetraselmis astigmatica, Strain CCMP880" /LENGTH=518 /DNA_ID=CAMNT_0005462991 /DNA_START=179 /DNA_END=1735 /DNA_ORIENTATION=-